LEEFLAKVVVITSGKGGVGKTTTSAAFAAGLALRGHKTVVIDFDVGLRNLDLVMGCERRVVFDFINVINGDANLNQALIKDKRNDNLFIFPTSQTRDKDALKREGVERVLEELKQQFDYIVCDSPAGIEHGAVTALYFADSAVIVTNPEVSSVRDSDRIIGILASRSRRAERNEPPVELNLLLTRYDPGRVSKGEMLTVEDVLEILSIPLLGVIPESESVLRASNTGTPVTFDEDSPAGRAYLDAVARFLGEQREMRFNRQGAAEDRPLPRAGEPLGARISSQAAERADRRCQPLCRDPRRYDPGQSRQIGRDLAAGDQYRDRGREAQAVSAPGWARRSGISPARQPGCRAAR
jgi:septum site-determining protein MinD